MAKNPYQKMTTPDAMAKAVQQKQAGEKKEDTIRFNFDMPRSLHKAFKLKALQNDDTMTDAVLRMIQEYVEKA